MAPRGKKKEGVVQEDTASERSTDENLQQPQTATQPTSYWPTTDEPTGRPNSPSASTWRQQVSPTSNPSKPTLFGSTYTPTTPYFTTTTGGQGALPQQVTHPTMIVPPEGGYFDTNQGQQSVERPIERQPSRQAQETPRSAIPAYTRGSNSAMIIEEDKGKVSHIKQVAVRPLKMIQGPLLDMADRKEYYSSIFVEFYAVQSLQSIMNDSEFSTSILERWRQALKIGGAYLSKRYSDDTKRSRNELSLADHTLLKEILGPLESLLRNIEKYSDGWNTGFKLNKHRLVAFTKRLLKLRDEMEDDFVIQGEGTPTVPHWGLEGNANLYWSANNFEVLGACYREEVTQFCVAIMAVYHAVRAEDSDTPVSILTVKGSSREHATTDTPTVKPENSRQKLFDDAPVTHSDRVQTFANKNASIFGNPSRNTASQKLAQLLSTRPTFIASAPNPNDPGGSDDGDDDQGSKRNPQGPSGGPSGGPPGGPPGGPTGGPSSGPSRGGSRRPPGGPPDPSNDPPSNVGGNKPNGRPGLPQFDNKLKVDIIPTWDGNTDELGRWLIKINRLSERSDIIYQQLGYLVPTRLSGPAELWYYSQSAAIRSRIEQDWGTLKNAIAGFYMNRNYMERQRTRANKARYRQAGYYTETPSEYFIRKLELLEIVYNYSEGELINEIMAGAPSYWSTILAPHLYDSIESFQMAIKYQEENLLRVGAETSRYRQDVYTAPRENCNPFTRMQAPATPAAKVHAVGWSKNAANPAFPKDDTNVSPRGTPEDKGGRPCRHCGSGKHWDPECKYARKGERKARVNAIATTPEDAQAQTEYENLYYGLETDDDEEDDSDFQ